MLRATFLMPSAISVICGWALFARNRPLRTQRIQSHNGLVVPSNTFWNRSTESHHSRRFRVQWSAAVSADWHSVPR